MSFLLAAVIVALLVRDYFSGVAHARHLAELVAEREVEAQAHRDQVQTLLNQIKPETAQPVILPGVVDPVPVDLESDESFWESKEALAERMMMEEVSHGR